MIVSARVLCPEIEEDEEARLMRVYSDTFCLLSSYGYSEERCREGAAVRTLKEWPRLAVLEVVDERMP